MLTTLVAVAVMALDGGQTDGGLTAASALSLKDVRVGDELEYSLGDSTLTMRACERTPQALRVAVSVQRDGGAPVGTWLLDRVVIALPLAPLPAPEPQLGRLVKELPMNVAGTRFGVCAQHQLDGLHDGSETFRCEARELILGGGLVQRSTHWFSSHGAGRSEVVLRRIATGSAGCPPLWPRATIDGTWRWDSSGVIFESRMRAGSSFVRKTERLLDSTEVRWKQDQYVLDFLLESLASLPEEVPVGGTFKVGGRTVRAFLLEAPRRTPRAWVAPQELADAPLGLRLENVGYIPPVSWSLDGGS